MSDADEFGADATNADDRLKALFAEDLPVGRDPVFQATLMERLARRRFAEDMLLISGGAALLGLVLWALWESFAPLVTSVSQQLAPAAAALTLAGLLVLVGGGQLPGVLRSEHD